MVVRNNSKDLDNWQVGLVALIITGESLEGQQEEHLNQHGVAVSPNVPRYNFSSVR